MSNPSSTSSSEPDRPRVRRVAWAIGLTLTLLLALNLGVQSALAPYWPHSEISKIIRALRHASGQPDAPPTVLFFGSSIFHSAILPEVFTDHAGEAEALRFLNCAQPSMTYWDYSKVLDHLDLKRLAVRACVVELTPWTFSTYSRHPVTKEIIRYRREIELWGNGHDLLAVEGVPLKARLLLRRLTAKHSLSEYLDIYRTFRHADPQSNQLPPPPFHSDTNLAYKLRTNPNFFPENIAPCHLLNYTFSAGHAAEFKSFLHRLQDQGIAVVLVHPPVKETYYAYVTQDPVRKSEFARHLAFLKELEKDYVVVNWQTVADAGFSEEVFVDYGHFSRTGAGIFSEALVRVILPPLQLAVRSASPKAGR